MVIRWAEWDAKFIIEEKSVMIFQAWDSSGFMSVRKMVDELCWVFVVVGLRRLRSCVRSG